MKATTSEFDCICIGTSMIVSLEACHQSKLGKSVLMVDKASTFGGAWKTIDFDEIKSVENAIHYFLPDDKGIDFMKTKLNWSVENSKGKYRYFELFKNRYIKFPYDSKIGRLIQKLFFTQFDKTKSRISQIINIISQVFTESGFRSFYVENGSKEMLKSIQDIVDGENIEIRYNTTLNKIFFDKNNSKVICNINNQEITAKSIIIGHGVRLPIIETSDGAIVLEEKFHPRPAYHLIVEDIKKSKCLELILAKDSLIKYVHDISRFSKLSNKNLTNIKIFVFALNHDVKNKDSLKEELFNKIVNFKLINKKAKIISSLYSDILLPTLYDEDLYHLKKELGDLVNILRTENFARGIGYYAERWNSKF